jgi:hypothetical protein
VASHSSIAKTGPALYLPLDSGKHTLRPVQHFLIRESDDANALCFEHRLALLVILLAFLVGRVVDLDAEPKLRRVEVDNSPFDRLLAAEFDTRQLPPSQVSPEFGFGTGLPVAQCLGKDFCMDSTSGVDLVDWRLPAHGDWVRYTREDFLVLMNIALGGTLP